MGGCSPSKVKKKEGEVRCLGKERDLLLAIVSEDTAAIRHLISTRQAEPLAVISDAVPPALFVACTLPLAVSLSAVLDAMGIRRREILKGKTTVGNDGEKTMMKKGDGHFFPLTESDVNETPPRALPVSWLAETPYASGLCSLHYAAAHLSLACVLELLSREGVNGNVVTRIEGGRKASAQVATASGASIASLGAETPHRQAESVLEQLTPLDLVAMAHCGGGGAAGGSQAALRVPPPAPTLNSTHGAKSNRARGNKGKITTATVTTVTTAAAIDHTAGQIGSVGAENPVGSHTSLESVLGSLLSHSEMLRGAKWVPEAEETVIRVARALVEKGRTMVRPRTVVHAARGGSVRLMAYLSERQPGVNRGVIMSEAITCGNAALVESMMPEHPGNGRACAEHCLRIGDEQVALRCLRAVVRSKPTALTHPHPATGLPLLHSAIVAGKDRIVRCLIRVPRALASVSSDEAFFSVPPGGTPGGRRTALLGDPWSGSRSRTRTQSSDLFKPPPSRKARLSSGAEDRDVVGTGTVPESARPQAAMRGMTSDPMVPATVSGVPSAARGSCDGGGGLASNPTVKINVHGPVASSTSSAGTLPPAADSKHGGSQGTSTTAGFLISASSSATASTTSTRGSTVAGGETNNAGVPPRDESAVKPGTNPGPHGKVQGLGAELQRDRKGSATGASAKSATARARAGSVISFTSAQSRVALAQVDLGDLEDPKPAPAVKHATLMAESDRTHTDSFTPGGRSDGLRYDSANGNGDDNDIDNDDDDDDDDDVDEDLACRVIAAELARFVTDDDHGIGNGGSDARPSVNRSSSTALGISATDLNDDTGEETAEPNPGQPHDNQQGQQDDGAPAISVFFPPRTTGLEAVIRACPDNTRLIARAVSLASDALANAGAMHAACETLSVPGVASLYWRGSVDLLARDLLGRTPLGIIEERVRADWLGGEASCPWASDVSAWDASDCARWAASIDVNINTAANSRAFDSKGSGSTNRFNSGGGSSGIVPSMSARSVAGSIAGSIAGSQGTLPALMAPPATAVRRGASDCVCWDVPSSGSGVLAIAAGTAGAELPDAVRVAACAAAAARAIAERLTPHTQGHFGSGKAGPPGRDWGPLETAMWLQGVAGQPRHVLVKAQNASVDGAELLTMDAAALSERLGVPGGEKGAQRLLRLIHEGGGE